MRRPFLVVTLALVILLTAAAAAAVPDPPVYITDNWPTPDASPVTALEQALLDRLNGASSTIDAALYDFSRPSLRDALIAAHGRGVAVRIVTDDEAKAGSTSKPFYDALGAAGIPIVDDQDGTRLMHDKYAIIDGQMVWTGSTNWSENDIAENHNNSLLFTSQGVAQVYQNDFDQMFGGRFGSAKTASPVTSLTYDGSPLEVYFSPQDHALDQVIAEVTVAQSTIDFAIFFFTDDQLRDALIAAKNRGVRIRGIFDELGAGNASSDDDSLCAAGVPVRVEQTAGKMHNKLMVIDADGADPRVVTGSLNWTAAGDERNAENIVILHDGEAAQSYTASFNVWWAGSPPRSGCEDNGIGGPSLRVYLPLAIRPEVAVQPTPTVTPVPATPTATPVAPTPTATTQPTGPCACTGNLYNCPDFPTQAAAQACFNWCMQEVGTDVHRLDSDGDGIACESLPLGWRIYGAADLGSE